MKNEKKPKIRFKGFDDDWEQRKLDDVMSTVTDYVAAGSFADLRKNVTYLSETNYAQLIRTVDLKKKFTNNDFVYVDENAFEYLWRVNLDEECIVLPNIGANIGEVYYVQPSDLPYENNVLGPNAILLKTNEDNYFVFTTLNTALFQKKLFENVGASGQPKFNKTELKSITLEMPSLEEQKQIGEYFRNFDNLITLHQRECDKLQKIKKSMLEKMFPQNEAKKPEIRFKGFNVDWEQRKLENLIIEYKETVDSNCTLPVLTSSKTEGVILQEEHFGRKQQHDITGYNVLPRSYCTYRNRSDGVDFTFNVNECCDMGIISKFYPVFCGNDNDTSFLSLVLNNSDEVVHEIAYTCTGTGQKVLSFIDLQKMSIRVPTHSEQKRISAFFKHLDHLITLHQRELEKMKYIKKSMLEKMFV